MRVRRGLWSIFANTKEIIQRQFLKGWISLSVLWISILRRCWSLGLLNDVAQADWRVLSYLDTRPQKQNLDKDQDDCLNNRGGKRQKGAKSPSHSALPQAFDRSGSHQGTPSRRTGVCIILFGGVFANSLSYQVT